MGNSQRVIGFYDVPMWKSIDEEAWAIQQCDHCQEFRYPPAPICQNCLSFDASWQTLKGTGTVVSTCVFHKKYFDDHVPPYTCAAVRLEEGPIVVVNLVDPAPADGAIDKRVEILYERHEQGMLPKVRFST